MSNRTMTLYLVGAVLGVSLASAGRTPLAVSPGDPDEFVLVEARCPTFSWAAVDGAEGYELVVYQVLEDAAQSEPVLVQNLPGAVTSWTPPLNRCLERNGRYAWSVRAAGPEGLGEWSAAAIFQVAAGLLEAELQQALEVVRRELVAEASAAGLREPEAPQGAKEEVTASAPEPEGNVSPRAQLVVSEGDIAVTSVGGVSYFQMDTRWQENPFAVHCDHISETGRLFLRLGESPGPRLYVCLHDGWSYVNLP